MPIADARKRKIGSTLVEWIYLGVRSGARQSVAEYRRYAVSNPTLALEHLRRAVNMPRRMRERINFFRTSHGLTQGQFNAQMGECLTLAGTVTLAELNTELTSLESDGMALIVAHQNTTMTNDQIADWIDANWSDDVAEWVFPFPPGYVDLWD